MEANTRRTTKTNDGKPPKSLLGWNLLFSSLMPSSVLEHVYDCMCMCVATMKVMNVIEFFCKENGYSVKEVS